MEEELDSQETKDSLDETNESGSWNKLLPLTTALIAVCAAVASLFSGSYSNEAILEKNNALLNQEKATDQWNYYQAKGIKLGISEGFYRQNPDEGLKSDIDKYTQQQKAIQKIATSFQLEVDKSNKKADLLLEKHHKEAYAVTFFQIAIALSAISALLKKQYFWYIALAFSAIGLYYFIIGLLLK